MDIPFSDPSPAIDLYMRMGSGNDKQDPDDDGGNGPWWEWLVIALVFAAIGFLFYITLKP